MGFPLSAIPRLLRFAPAFVVLAWGPSPRAADCPKPADEVTPVTKEQLATKLPNFFCYDYPFDATPGRRLWMRVDDKTYIERYPNGSDSKFTIVGHTNARGMEGTIVAKVAGDEGAANDGKFQVFVPDKDGEELAILFRADPKAEWRDMSWSQNRKTIIVKVE